MIQKIFSLLRLASTGALLVWTFGGAYVLLSTSYSGFGSVIGKITMYALGIILLIVLRDYFKEKSLPPIILDPAFLDGHK